MLPAKHQRPSHKAKTRDYLRKHRESGVVLKQAQALARSGRFASHQEIVRELERVSGSERAREWFARFEIQAQLDALCKQARSRDANGT